MDTLSNLGVISRMEHQNHNAIRYFSKAIQIKGNEAYLWNRLAECYIDINDIERAKDAFKKSTLVDGKPENVKGIMMILDSKKTGNNNESINHHWN